MPDKRTQSAMEAFRNAQTNGWGTYGKPGSLRRITKHQTPDRIPDRWWGAPEYSEVEFVSFTAVDGRVTSAFYCHALNPWTDRRDQKISVKRAIEILSSPDANAANLIIHPKRNER